MGNVEEAMLQIAYMAVEEKWKSTIKCCYHVCPGVYCYIFEKGGDRIVSLGVMGGGITPYSCILLLYECWGFE